MSEENGYLKIEVPVEEETPFVPEQPKQTTADAVKTQAATVAKQAWDSEFVKRQPKG